MEPDGHLELMLINKNPDAAVNEQFNLQGFTPAAQAEFWQYGETQDYAQSQSATGASSLANFTSNINVSGNTFSYLLPAYSMTVIDLAPAPAFASQSGSTLSLNLTPVAPVILSNTGSAIIASQNGVQLNFTNVSSIVVNQTGASSVLNVTSSPSILFTFLNTANTTINVAAGTMTIAAVPGGSVNIGTLSIAAGHSAALAPATTSQATTLNLTNLSIASTAQFDIANNIVFINYRNNPDPIASIAGYLTTGFNAGAWTGPGISSSIAANTSATNGVGYADSTDPGNPAGLPTGTIKIMYTLLGDTDLNGIVNGIDFAVLAANFNKGVTGWDQGDFDYNGIINGIDFVDLTANFNQGLNITAALSLPAVTTVLSTTTPNLVVTQPTGQPPSRNLNHHH